MGTNELIEDSSKLEKIADLLSEEIRNPNEDIISRYIKVVYDSATFDNGKKSEWRYFRGNLNKERISAGVYTQTDINYLFPDNFGELIVARDLQIHRFKFSPKGIELPTGEELYIEPIPSCVDTYDEELREFSRKHKKTRLERRLTVEHRVIVNSKGGKAIQTIPFFKIEYNHRYEPLQTNRKIGVVCTSEKDIKRLPNLIKYLADPTLDKRIKKAKSFSEAFHKLNEISGLKYGSLEEAGIPLSGLYDIVMFTGVPVHEIFGHHFEEPIRFLDFEESGTFKYGQNIQNKGIVFMDNPRQEVEGFKVVGFTNVDSYGRKREPRIHIKNGKVVGFLGSEYADPEKLKKYLGLEKSDFVGNASQYIDGHFPQPRMSCTVLDGPTEDIDLEGRIIAITGGGITDPISKIYGVRIYEAYVIKNGEPKRIIPLSITGGINQALANIHLLDDLNYRIGECEKPEPIYYPQPKGQAEVPVSQFTKSQIWERQQVYPLPISDAHLKILLDRDSG